MASIGEFIGLLMAKKMDEAFSTYFFNIDSSLDRDEMVKQECRIQPVCFEFVEPNIILMRDPGENPTPFQNEIWYLPWVRDGASKAVLDGTGPAFFSTSQLDGCRFSIQYDNTERKKVTVFHLSGTFGQNQKGSQRRSELEEAEGLDPNLEPRALTRRYSMSSGVRGNRENLGEDFLLKYDGNKASIFGFRYPDGSWHFSAQQMYAPTFRLPHETVKTGKPLRDLTAI